ncbi:MAG: potassium/proton antiporter [Thermoanaerobaculia bacterium]
MNANLLVTTSLEHLLLGIALLLLLSLLASKASGRFGIPALLVFIFLGMLAGSEGIGGIYFDNAQAAQWLGVVALAFILFAGGLETSWSFVRPSVWRGISLSTIGVIITALIVAWVASRYLGFSFAEGFLLGSIVSATDAAAVFSILRSSGVKVDEKVVSTLELESGSNDPTAVFLTAAAIGMIVNHGGGHPAWRVALDFLREMSLGALIGIAAGFAAVWLLNKVELQFDGLYPVFTIAMVMFTYAAGHLGGGNGFLAVYLAGIVMGNRNFIQRRSLTRFHDGIAWLMQIAMFVVLGLLVFPSQLPPVAKTSLIVTGVLTFVARPLAVFVSLAASSLDWREKTFIAWVGLRGAVPIILATFPLLAGVPKSAMIFNVVFFVVLASVALQGTTIPLVARWLRLGHAALEDHSQAVARLSSRGDSALVTLEVGRHSAVDGRRVVEIDGWPRDALILVLYRGADFFVPNGGTKLVAGDRFIVLANKSNVDSISAMAEGSPALQ